MDSFKILTRELAYLILCGLSFFPNWLGRTTALMLIALLIYRFIRNAIVARAEWSNLGRLKTKDEP